MIISNRRRLYTTTTKITPVVQTVEVNLTWGNSSASCELSQDIFDANINNEYIGYRVSVPLCALRYDIVESVKADASNYIDYLNNLIMEWSGNINGYNTYGQTALFNNININSVYFKEDQGGYTFLMLDLKMKVNQAAFSDIQDDVERVATTYSLPVNTTSELYGSGSFNLFSITRFENLIKGLGSYLLFSPNGITVKFEGNKYIQDAQAFDSVYIDNTISFDYPVTIESSVECDITRDINNFSDEYDYMIDVRRANFNMPYIYPSSLVLYEYFSYGGIDIVNDEAYLNKPWWMFRPYNPEDEETFTIEAYRYDGYTNDQNGGDHRCILKYSIINQNYMAVVP